MTNTSHPSRWCVAVLTCAIATVGGLSFAQATRPTTATRPATRPAAAARAEADKHYQAAAALRDQNKFQEAWVENQKALALDPTHPMATLLRKVLQDKLGADSTPGGTAAADTDVPAGARIKPLTPQQISSIRLLEMTNDDTRIRGSIDRKTLQEFWDKVIKKEPDANPTQQEYESFMSPNNFVGQVRRIRDSGHPEYLKQVRITSDPADMIAFRNNVYPYILASCATAECHLGEKAGALRLLPGRDDAALYTNFYLLSTYAVKGGGKLIDRQNPDNSLILQYGLPATVAANPHKPAIPQRFSGTSDPRHKAILDWIGTLALPQPHYDVKLENAATQSK